MTLGLWASSAWLTEFALESSGAILSYRRRLFALSALLGFRALADIFTFIVAWRWGWRAYSYVLWPCKAIQGLLLCALALQIVAKQVREWQRLGPYLWLLLGGFIAVVGFAAYNADNWAGRFLDAEIATSGFLGVVIAVGYLSEKARLEEPWGIVSVGVLVAVAGNALCALLWHRWPNASGLYPIPAILALILWNIASLRNGRQSLRISLPPKIPAQSVMAREVSRRVQ